MAIVSKNPTINFKDFDFTVDRTRQKILSSSFYDGSATIRLPGKNRKTANHELMLLPFFRRNTLTFKKVAIGKSKHNKSHILVFDNSALEPDNAMIRAYGNPSAGGFINSKGHVEKLFKLLGEALPKKLNEVAKIYFRLTPVKKSKHKVDYKTCIISHIKTTAQRKRPQKAVKKTKTAKPHKKSAPSKKGEQSNFL
jgi:hypothetical protein